MPPSSSCSCSRLAVRRPCHLFSHRRLLLSALFPSRLLFSLRLLISTTKLFIDSPQCYIQWFENHPFIQRIAKPPEDAYVQHGRGEIDKRGFVFTEGP